MFHVIKLKNLEIFEDEDENFTGCVNLKELLESPVLDKENFTRTSVGLNNTSILDLTQRSSWTNKKNFLILPEEADEFFSINDLKYDDKKYQLLKYEEGDFFSEHKDRKLAENHKYTCLIFFNDCKEKLEGGNLILRDEDNLFKIVFDSSNVDIATMVIFSIDLYHEVKPVTKGTRYVFKSQLYTSSTSIEDEDVEEEQGYLMDVGCNADY